MTLPTFRAYFQGVHGFEPFPWQERLADTVLVKGWPALLDLPTGVGKTSALDIALYTFAAAPTRMPRRAVLVVDRRIVVDQGALLARKILRKLKTPDNDATRAFVDALRESWGAGADEDPFAVAVLRGGMPRDNDWARRPDQPVLGVSTVDQVGSRLFFRGYGVGVRSASIHAGLMGNDTLILLDEVHLAVPFAETLAAVQTRFRPRAARVPERFAVVQMSATARAPENATDAFRLDAGDRDHPVLQKRLSATKRAHLVSVKVKGDDETAKRRVLAEAATARALELQKAGATVVGVVVNRVETARIAARLLEGKATTVLVTGRMRPIDRDRIVSENLLPSAGNGRSRAQAKPLIVIATQCIEAGADLDFDALVTECASLDALRQRFGRLDRSGELHSSQAVILARSDQTADSAEPDPIYGDALSATWRWLISGAEDAVVDFGVDALSSRLADATAGLVATAPAAPVLLPAHLDAWAQTSPRPNADPDIALWLHGPERALPDVQVVWRSELDDLFDDLAGVEDPSSLDDEARIRLEACRPSSLEAITLPLSAALGWLLGESRDLADVETMLDAETRDDRRKAGQWVFRWAAERERCGFVQARRESIRPGDILVVPCSRGGLANDNFDAEALEGVTDLGDLAQLRARGVASLRLRAAAVRLWAPEVAQAPLPDEAETTSEARQRIAAWLGSWPETPPRERGVSFAGTDEEWRSLHKALAPVKRAPLIVGGARTVASGATTPERGPYFLIAQRLPKVHQEISEAVTEDDDSSFRAGEVTLAVHSADVRAFARRFAERVGFPPELVDDVVLAAWVHDVGKADPRFQRWLVGGSEVALAMLSAPLAKSALESGSRAAREQARQRAGYPRGYRHELLSLKMAIDTPTLLEGAHDRELVLHLVASHHGWCRPFPPLDDHPDDFMVEVRHGDLDVRGSTRHKQALLDSGASERFWALVERYGWWGLAWLEAVLRLADHRASEMRAEGV